MWPRQKSNRKFKPRRVNSKKKKKKAVAQKLRLSNKLRNSFNRKVH